MVNLLRETGSVRKKTRGGKPTKQIPKTAENVRQVIENNPHTTWQKLLQVQQTVIVTQMTFRIAEIDVICNLCYAIPLL